MKTKVLFAVFAVCVLCATTNADSEHLSIQDEISSVVAKSSSEQASNIEKRSKKLADFLVKFKVDMSRNKSDQVPEALSDKYVMLKYHLFVALTKAGYSRSWSVFTDFMDQPESEWQRANEKADLVESIYKRTNKQGSGIATYPYSSGSVTYPSYPSYPYSSYSYYPSYPYSSYSYYPRYYGAYSYGYIPGTNPFAYPFVPR